VGTSFACGSSTATLAPAGTLTCTATYSVSQADLTAGSVTNTASASGAGLTSNTASATVKAAVTPPMILAVMPNEMGQGAVKQNVYIVGLTFGDGTWTPMSVQFSGTGITVNSVTRTNLFVLTVSVSVLPNAATTLRDVTVVNPDGGRVTELHGSDVDPAPSIGSLSPTSLGQGAASQIVVITGSNFLSGTWPNSSVAFSGTGITVNSVSRSDSTHLTVIISVSATATVGGRSVTVTNLDGGVGSLGSAFTVNARPTITSLNPSSLRHGLSNQAMTITGTGFVNGATVSFSGTGITVNSVSWTNATHVAVVISLSASTATGTRNVTVTNPDAGLFTVSNGFTVLN
jgi:ABC-type transporter Mla MlaB component